MTKKRQPLRAAAAAPSKEKEGGTKRQKVEDSVDERSKTSKSSSSSNRRDDDDDDDDDEEDDDEDDDDDIALEGQLHFTEPITFEFNDPKEEYAESITVLLKQVVTYFLLSYYIFTIIYIKSRLKSVLLHYQYSLYKIQRKLTH